MPDTTTREAEARAERNARLLARRAQRLATAQPELRARCTVGRCAAYLYRGGRCEDHWLPMRHLVATMAGAENTERVSRRLFSEAMATTTMRLVEWADLAEYHQAGLGPDSPEISGLLDRATDALYAAGWYIGRGPRGGGYLLRKAVA